MKKIILLTVIIILIPLLILQVFNNTEVKFDFVENTFVRLKRNNTGNIDVLPLEEYVVGVVAGEIPVTFHDEALKAQAVAARTYVLKKMENNKGEFDVIDTTANQVYIDNATLKEKWGINYIKNINKIRNAVQETKGEYMTYNGEIITAFFFSTSVGKTENSEDIFSSALPYLRSVASPWDENISPVFNEKSKFNLVDFYKYLNLSYNSKLSYKILSTTSTGRIKTISINNTIFSGQTVAQALNLRSSFFTIEQDNNDVYITTKGYGHGVGMSQYGAYGMAMQGYKYNEILKYYYKDIEIVKK